MRNFNLTPRAQKLVKEAHKIASQLEHGEINHLHVLLAFFCIPNNQILDAFDFFEENTDNIQKACFFILDKNYSAQNPNEEYSKPIISKLTKKAFSCAKQISVKYDHKYIGLEHVFLALFETTDFFIRSLISKVDINYDKILDYVEKKLEEEDLLPSSLEEEEESEEKKKVNLILKNINF